MMAEYTLDDLLHLVRGDDLALLRLDAAQGDGATMTKGHTCRTSVSLVMMTTGTTHEPFQLDIVEGLEEILVIHLELTLLQALVGDPDVLIVVTYLVGMGVETTVGGDDAVAVEVIVAGRILAVVATIGEDLTTRDRALVAHALIYEVPDITTLILRILTHQVPVLLEATHGVTHGVGILTLDERTGVVALRVGLAALVAIVHRTEDVGLAVLTCLLKLAGTGLVGSLHPVVGLLEVRTVASLVAQ